MRERLGSGRISRRSTREEIVVFGQTCGIGACLAPVFQDGMDGMLLEDEGDDSHVAATSQAAKRVDFEDAL